MAQEDISEKVMNGNCSEFIDSTLNLYRQLRERGLDAYTFMHNYADGHYALHSDKYFIALPDEERRERDGNILILQSDIKLLSQYEIKARSSSIVHNLPIKRIISEGCVERAKIIDGTDITNLLKDGFSRQTVC